MEVRKIPDLTIEANVKQFAEALDFFHAVNRDILVADFAKMLSHGMAPSTMWELLAHGAFKETYDTNDANYIIKFASECNETERERETIEIASRDYNLGHLFPTTIFIPLAIALPATYLESDDDSWTYDCDVHTYVERDDSIALTWVIVQQRMSCTCEQNNDHENPYDEEQYNQQPVLWSTGEPISYKNVIRDMYIDSLSWVQSVIDFYGDDCLRELCNFINDYNIGDLHSRNLGYDCNYKPIIFDWLS